MNENDLTFETLIDIHSYMRPIDTIETPEATCVRPQAQVFVAELRTHDLGNVLHITLRVWRCSVLSSLTILYFHSQSCDEMHLSAVQSIFLGGTEHRRPSTSSSRERT